MACWISLQHTTPQQHTSIDMQHTTHQPHTSTDMQHTTPQQHTSTDMQHTTPQQHISTEPALPHPPHPPNQTRSCNHGLYFRDSLLFCTGEHTHTHTRTHTCTHTCPLHPEITSKHSWPGSALLSPSAPPPPPTQVCLCKGKVLPEEDTVIEGVGLWGTGAQAAAVGDHVLHPLQQRVQAQQSRLRHLLHKIGVFHRVARIRQRQTHAWPTSTPAYNSNSMQL